MGWCSATDIMDTTVRAALAMVEHDAADPLPDAIREKLRPFVKAVAGQLNDRDWDCWEESDFFNDFPQEMLGYDDAEFARWKREILSEWDGTAADWPRWAGPVPASADYS